MSIQPADIYQKIKLTGLTVFLVFLFMALPSVAMAWPTDSQWIPVLKNGDPLRDDDLDASNWVNIVPDNGTSPAAYFYNDGSYLYYRIRLDDDPRAPSGTGLRPFGWGFEIDTDQNPDDYEWLVMLNGGVGGSENISLRENTDKTGFGDPSDKAEYVAAEYPLTGNYQVVAADTSTNGDQDYFIDFRLPYAVFLAATGITDNTLIRYFIGSSNSTNNLVADLVGTDLYDGLTDYTSPTGQLPSVTFYDGGVRFVDSLDGFNDKEVETAGNPIYIRVDDLDQTIDLNPAQTIRVILTSAGTLDEETVILTATGVSGKFTGSIPSATGGASSQDGTLQVLTDDTVTVTYVDAIAADLSQSVNRTDSLLIVSTGTDLTINKVVDKPIPGEGDTIVYTLTVTNNGPADTLSSTVTDTLPAGVSYVSSTGDGSFLPGPPGTWNFGALAVGDSATVNITATVDTGAAGEPQPIVNTATITASSPADVYAVNNTATASINVGGTDFRVTKDVSNPGPNTGDTITYSVRVFNIGSNDGTNVVVSDLLPVGVDYVSDTGGGTYTPASRTLVWNVGSLDAGTGALLEITANVTAATGSILTNTANFTSADQPDSDPTNDSASVDIQVGFVDLAITKIVDKPAPIETDTIEYTLTVTNNGPNDASNITVTDNLPIGVTYVSDDGAPGTYSGGVWTIGNLNSGSSAVLKITATVDSGTAGQTIINTADINIAAVPEPDSEPANDSDSATIQIDGADLMLTKTVTANLTDPGNLFTPNENDEIVYLLTITNNGPNTATGVIVTDIPPAGVAYEGKNPSAGTTYDTTGGNPSWEWDIGTLNVATSATLEITVSVDGGTAGQTITNVGFITASDQLDYDELNNVASVDIAVNGTDLAVTKTVDDSTPDINDTVTYTITVANNGLIPATNLEITDLLPPELTFVAPAIPSQGTYDHVSGIWAMVSPLPASTTATITIDASVNPSASGLTVTNTASISAVDQGDPTPANNSASVDIYVGGTDLLINKIVDDDFPAETSTITYTITVNNPGTSDATNVEVQDILPAGVTFVSDNPSQGSYAAGLWLVGTVSAGTSATLDLAATVNPFTAGSTITNTATIIALDQIDPDPSNNSASVDIDPVSLPVLSILKSAVGGITSANPGDIITYELTILNAGTGLGANVVAHDHMSGYTQWQLDFGSGNPFEWIPGTSGLTFDQANPTHVQFSNDGGSTWAATPISGQGGAPAGYDATITNWRINMQGNMAASGTFTLRYRVRVE
jgi:uncharacterized repeat protein (TIGR01451 family)